MKHETQEYRRRVFTEWRHLIWAWSDGQVHAALSALTELPESVVKAIVEEQAAAWVKTEV